MFSIEQLSTKIEGTNSFEPLEDATYAFIGMAKTSFKAKKGGNTETIYYYTPIVATIVNGNAVTARLVGKTELRRTIGKMDVDKDLRQVNTGTFLTALEAIFSTNVGMKTDEVWFNKVLPQLYGKTFKTKRTLFYYLNKDSKRTPGTVYEMTATADNYNLSNDTPNLERFCERIGLTKANGAIPQTYWIAQQAQDQFTFTAQ